MRGIILFLAYVLFTSLLITPSSSALQSKLKLEILPINCIFEIVDTGTNKVNYITPVECGKYVPPPPLPEPPAEPPITPTPTSGGSNNGSGGTPTPISPTITTITEPPRLIDASPSINSDVFLNQFTSFVEQSGLVISLNADSRALFYTMSTSAVVSQHSIRIIEIGSYYAILLIASDPFTVTLRINETGEYDVDGDGLTDIVVRLLSLTGSSVQLVVRGVNNWCQTYTAREPNENSISPEGVLAFQIFCNQVDILEGTSITRTIEKSSAADLRPWMIAAGFLVILLIISVAQRRNRLS